MQLQHRITKFFGKHSTGMLFLIPAVTLNAVFFIYPLFRVVQMSFYNWTVLGTSQYLALGNYERLFGDPLFWKALSNTLIYTIIVTPGIFVTAFALALLLNNTWKWTTFFRTVYFMPVAISFVVASLVFLWIYNELYGILNYVLSVLGLISTRISWLGTAWMARFSVSLMVVWKTAGFSMMILLAGLQGIPRHVNEAADLDGVSFWQRFMYITFPIIRPTFVLALLVSLIGSFLAFDHFHVMTKGGPAYETMTIVMYMFRTAFEYFNLGYGSAMSIVLLLILIVLSVIQTRFLGSDNVE
ncbi:MAG: carbohydrate ABC transporter permease [Limnochordia bacterium]|jgi:multiple sugar transport system permease protein